MSVTALFESQAATALKLRESTAAERRAKLARLLEAIHRHSDALRSAARLDLGRHPTETNVIELLPLIGEVKHARVHLRRWMRPRSP
jgi:aldehyde dehydrogenase (NAD+)